MNAAISTIFSRFASVGIANTFLSALLIFSLMHFFSLGPILSNAAGYAVGVVSSYVLNARWTFASRRNQENLFLAYVAIVFISYLVNITAVYFCLNFIFLNPYLSQLVGMALYTSVSFLALNGFVFKERS